MKFFSLSHRSAVFWGAVAVGFGAVLVALLVVFGGDGPSASGGPKRISFQIATGSTSGTYFPVGEFIAGLISHPPGVGRCETQGVCGPPGLIVNARATEGSVANVLAVEGGLSNSALAQADIVALAAAGRGPFAKSGRARNIRLIAELYPEAVHLVAATKAGILTVSDLRGKRVSLSTQGSGTLTTARAVLAAYRLSERRIHPVYEPADRAAELLSEGKLDAFFFVGGTPVRLIQQLLEQEIAVLIPIEGRERDQLLAKQKQLAPYVIAQGTYPGSPSIETVSVGALWITNASQPDDLIAAMVRALYNPVNRAQIAATYPDPAWMSLDIATKDRIVPFHPGAARYYREIGLLASDDATADP